MNRQIGILVLVSALALAACGKPVPPEKSAYVGEWQSQTISLLITQDGSVAYKRLQAGATRSITGPLKGFEGDDFEVGIAFISTTFVVSTPPFQENGKWKMVVDGVELTKVE